jgi:copper chaperone CopZ
MSTRTYNVTGMSCGHCEMAVSEEVSEVAGVGTIDVSAQSGILSIEAEESVRDADVIAAVEEAGYSAVRSE